MTAKKKSDNHEAETAADFKRLVLALLPQWKGQLLDARQGAETNVKYIELTGKADLVDYLAQEIGRLPVGQE